MNVKNNTKVGFSLVEVLIFVSVVALFFVIAATISSFSLRVSKSNENKILATRYAEELVEWLRGEKEADWEAFKGKADKTYCFYKSPIGTWDNSKTIGPCSGYELGNPPLFNRELQISTITSDPNQLNIVVTVSWQDGQNTFNVPLRTVFSRFE